MGVGPVIRVNGAVATTRFTMDTATGVVPEWSRFRLLPNGSNPSGTSEGSVE